MKRFLLLSVCVLLINTLSAQWSSEWLLSSKNKHLLYANGDLMVGNSSGGNLGMSFVYDCKYSVEVGYSATSNQFTMPILGLKSADKSNTTDKIIPGQMMENFNFMAGRHFNMNTNETIRFVLQGGPGMSVMMDLTDIPSGSNSNSFMTTKMIKTKDFSMMVNSKFEFLITDLIGFSAGPTLIMNQDKRFLTFSAGVMYGIISKNHYR
jgi:hypothetical protein